MIKIKVSTHGSNQYIHKMLESHFNVRTSLGDFKLRQTCLLQNKTNLRSTKNYKGSTNNKSLMVRKKKGNKDKEIK